jgi:hypothetical protein
MNKTLAIACFALVACKAAAPTAAAVDKELAVGSPLDLGKGVTVTFAKTQNDQGAPNIVQTSKHTVTANCGGKDVVVLDREDKGGNTKVSVKSAGDQATFTMATHIAREGEVSDHTDTALFDLGACTVTKK